jgi:hypothetical protein
MDVLDAQVGMRLSEVETSFCLSRGVGVKFGRMSVGEAG